MPLHQHMSKTFPLKISVITGALILAAACAPSLVRQSWDNTYSGSAEDAFVTDDTFTCLTDWEQVGNSYYTNVNGHVDETLAVAKNPEGGVYPVGSLVQLFPGEAMVKRGAGYNPEAGDWEFFLIEIVDGQTVIKDRGLDLKNPLGTCTSCHAQAEPKYDLVCGTDHGCKKLPGFATKLAARDIAKDSRCKQ